MTHQPFLPPGGLSATKQADLPGAQPFQTALGTGGNMTKIAHKLNTKTGRQYRLPTEAKWEYASNGGSQSEYCGSEDVNAVVWYGGDIFKSSTHPVGQKQANGYGLYDMSGNVWEWMQGGRVLRGGSWCDDPLFLRSAFRYDDVAAFPYVCRGFRLARTLP